MKYKIGIPKYAQAPIIGMVAMNVFTYYITPVWTSYMKHYCLETKWDRVLPFVPVFVVPYILAYVQWIVGYLAVAKTNKEYSNYIFHAEIIAKFIVCLIYLAMPTTMDRAIIRNQGFFSKLVLYIYIGDRPINLFPSIHCLESWFCFRGSMNRQFFHWKYTAIMGISAILIFLSTVLIKQHVLVDMLGAVVVAELALLICRSWRKVFENRHRTVF